MGAIGPIIGYSQKIKQCDDAVIENLKQHKADLIKERDTIITVLKEFLSQPISMAELDDDM